MCKHGERDDLPCVLCDQESIDRLTTAPIDMEDWVPEMGWELEDYE